MRDMNRLLTIAAIVILLGASFVVGYFVGQRHGTRRARADWRMERIALHGENRDLKERSRQLESAWRRAKARAATKPTTTSSGPAGPTGRP